MWQGNLFLQRPKISSFHWNSSRTKDYPTPKSSNFLIITFSRTTFFYKITFQLKLFLHISLDDKSQNCSTIKFHSTVNCPYVDKMDPRESNLLKIMVKVLSTGGLFKFVGLSSRLITADPSIIFSFHHYPRLVGCQSNPRIGSFFKLTSQKGILSSTFPRFLFSIKGWWSGSALQIPLFPQIVFQCHRQIYFTYYWFIFTTYMPCHQ